MKAQNGWNCSSFCRSCRFRRPAAPYELRAGLTSSLERNRESILLLTACGLVLFSTLLMRPAPPICPRQGWTRSRPTSAPPAYLRRRALRRGRARLPRLLRPEAGRAGGQWARLRRLPHGRQTISSCRRQASRRGSRRLQLRRRRHPQADDPLFRPIDADDFRTNGENASDFSNLRQNGLVRITFPLPPNIRLIDPATNAPSAETFVDVWRSVPTVNDVALTGADE